MPVCLRGLTPVAVAIAALLCAGTARAQDKVDANKAAAKEHYNSGTSFYDLQRYDEAAKEFEAAMANASKEKGALLQVTRANGESDFVVLKVK